MQTIKHPSNTRNFMRSNQLPQRNDTSLYSNNLPSWYTGMDEKQKYQYEQNLPRTSYSSVIPKNYQREAENKGWVLHNEDGNVYFTHYKYDDTHFKAIYYKPWNVDDKYAQYIPYVPRKEDIHGLGYILITEDGITSTVSSNEWQDLFDSRFGRRLMAKKAYKSYCNEVKKKSL